MGFIITPKIEKSRKSFDTFDAVRLFIIICGIVSFAFVVDYLYADTDIVQASVIDKATVYDEDFTYYYLYIDTVDKIAEVQTDKGHYVDVTVGDFIDVQRRTTKMFGITYYNY